MERATWLPATPAGVPQARAIVREVADDLRLDGGIKWELMLATSEAFANAVEHGSPCDPRGILLRVETRDGRVGVEVRDCGGRYETRRGSRKEPGLGGRGMPIIAAVMDQLEVVPDTGATCVRFAKRLAVG
jgi:serine/threonine-protein kinase RsbW